jgi:hypothetical protein
MMKSGSGIENTLDKAEFAHQVSAWIDPRLVIEAGIKKETNISNAFIRASICIISEILKPNNDGGYSALVADFLEQFRISHGLLEILSLTNVPVKITDNTWKWLREIRFEGKIVTIDGSDRKYPPKTILVVEERDCIADLLFQPLNFLVETVSRIVEQMGKVKDISVFLNPLSPGPFFTYIESRVWSALNMKVAGNAPLTDGVTVNNRYRAVTVIGNPPISRDHLYGIRQIAKGLAAETLEPIDDKR